LTNANQPEDYTMVISKASDRISQVTKKYSGGNIIITAPYMYTSLDTYFFYRDFVKDGLRYYNLSPA
jgi:hypothetical protein